MQGSLRSRKSSVREVETISYAIKSSMTYLSLANEKKAQLSDEEKARRSVTINLDGLDRNTIIKLAVKVCRISKHLGVILLRSKRCDQRAII
jgi:hypothetical protein